MYILPIWLFLLVGTSISFAQLGPAPASENGAAIIVNDCSFPVYYKSVSNQSVLPSIIPPGKTYKETYRLNIVNGTLNANGSVNGTLGGISIKLSPNQTIANTLNESDAFDASTITQFEYTYDPDKAPGLWYDISNINGYLDEPDSTWPFDLYGGLNLTSTSTECPSVACAPNTAICSAAYTKWNDDWAAHGCRNNNSLILTLCSIVGDAKVLEQTALDDLGSVRDNSGTDFSTVDCRSR